MGTSQGLPPGGAHRSLTAQRSVTAAGYVMLFALGAVQGLIGSFQYGQAPAPLIAIILAVVIFATCAACGWGLGTFSAGLMPAIGWIFASFILAMPKSNGSVIITATAAGEWYLYGGALGSAAGCITAFFTRLRRPAPPR
jgi:hypothetical protein